MKQYLDLLREIKENGTNKAPARENMPGTRAIFGHQCRFKLSDGFPAPTTKKMNFRLVVVELLWFLRADTNIKFLIDNGFNLWNEDAYNYYQKKCKEQSIQNILGYEYFIKFITNCIDKNDLEVNSRKNSVEDEEGNLPCIPTNYTLGDCGFQYGKVWRSWESYETYTTKENGTYTHETIQVPDIDQIVKVLNSLRENPEGRRHLVTAIDPANDNDLALYWCHALFQFNCRKVEYFEGDGMTYGEKGKWYRWVTKPNMNKTMFDFVELEAKSKEEILTNDLYPEYYLDCQLYQRSGDVFLGVPFNTASYSLLVHIFCEILNMIPGDFVHTFGDVHIYDNHREQVDLQLSREPKKLPTLRINTEFWGIEKSDARVFFKKDEKITSSSFSYFIEVISVDDFSLEGYDPHPFIKGELSTGLIKK